ncbi:hypothetical protein WR25_18130 [Diploscapter pachys]|uniref:Mothers against decapentaplegic homolog n=1 Tax=Diploscapter pachys TaxID=2018661 RepID=A0A2A2JG56_9BILA|nr:hypothetical protein WR25_18130 [Diploscapter pachys]
MDCGMWCVFSERRRHIERLWRRRLLVTSDERRARRRFLRLMRGFDAEDVEVIRKAVESNGIDSKACAPGPPMDEREDEAPPDEDSGLIPQIDRPMSMPYLCCKLWRWKDLQVDAALHRLEALPWCRFGRVTINNATVSCCNPYHYALWIRPEINGNDDESGRNSETRDRRDQIVGNGHIGHITYRSHHNAATEIDLQTRLPRVLSSEIPDRPPPSIPSESPPPPDDSPPGTSTSTPLPPPLLHHAMSHAWGRLTRWERKDQIADPVQLTGPFAAVGILSQSVHDAQIVCSEWDLKNEVSFALIRQTEPLGSDNPEDIWLYNSGTKPLFLCVNATSPHSSSSRTDSIRRLSPGYCVRVYRGEVTASAPASERALGRRRISRDPALSRGDLIISVGRGWGPNYSRLFVTDIPCRYEISFS